MRRGCVRYGWEICRRCAANVNRTCVGGLSKVSEMCRIYVGSLSAILGRFFAFIVGGVSRDFLSLLLRNRCAALLGDWYRYI